MLVSCFNPHPARGPGATPAGLVSVRHDRERFNPHPARGPGATARFLSPLPSCRTVSILTRPVGRVQLARRSLPHVLAVVVSILTRPVGRVQPIRPRPPTTVSTSFNPHPARGPGATVKRDYQDAIVGEFQSSPGPWAGCNTRSVRRPDMRTRVSILTRPVGRVQLCRSQRRNPLVSVSILTRPVGRVQPALARPVCPTCSTFQSSPGPWAGCNGGSWQPGSPATRVSILTRPVGRVQHEGLAGFGRGWRVSILTRPVGRVQQSRGRLEWRVVNVSILTLPVGRVQHVALRQSGRRQRRFNPHPARGPGATSRKRSWFLNPVSFNPHPARGPGATC